MGVIPSGTVLDKTDYIRYHCQPNLGLMALEEYPMSQTLIRRYGPVAVVSRSVQAQLRRPDGQLIRVKVQRLEVCIQEAGTWRVARGQGTEVNPFLRP